MKNQILIHIKNIVTYFSAVMILLLMLPCAAIAQYVGPTSVTAGQTASYSYTRPSNFGALYWTNTNSNVTSVVIRSTDPKTADFTIIWGSTGSGTFQLYDGATSLGTMTATISACVAPSAPTLVTATPSSVCTYSATTLTATPAAGTTIKWFNAMTGGVELGIGTPFLRTLSSATTFYAASYNTVTGCISTRIAVSVTMNGLSSGGTTGAYIPPVTFGHGTVAISLPVIVAPYVYKLYSSATATSPLAMSQDVLTTPDISTTTSFFVSKYNYSNSCESGRTEMIAVVSPTVSPNKVQHDIVRVSGITLLSQIPTLTDLQKKMVNTYYDGLSRLNQKIEVRTSPTAQDLVSPGDFDSYSRPYRNYLPYATPGFTTGDYQSSFPTNQASFYNNASDKVADDLNPYAVTVYEPSPEARVSEEGGLGANFQPGTTHTNRYFYTFNAGTSGDQLDEVRAFNSDATSSAFFSANILTKTTVADQNLNSTVTYKDQLDRVIAIKRQIGTSNYTETYYVYDDLNQLRYVIPPTAVTYLKANGWSWGTPATTLLDQHAYQYLYDGRGRLVELKAPGKAVVNYIYDRMNRLVLTQDGNLRASNYWNFIKYDGKGRVVSSGIYTNTTNTTRSSMQGVVDLLYSVTTAPWFESRATSAYGYTNVSFPTTSTQILIENYYDNYDFDNGLTVGGDVPYSVRSLPGENSPGPATDLMTGIRKKILGSSNWLSEYRFYDIYGRLIQTSTNNHLSAMVDNVKTNVFDFEKLLMTQTFHNTGTASVTTLDQFSYDNSGRLIGVSQKIDTGAPQIIAAYNYNEIGQLVEKNLHATGANFLQSVDYRYTIKGQISSINNSQLTNDGIADDYYTDYFGMNILYDTYDAGIINSPQYNGNISAIKWKSPLSGAGVAAQRSYIYTYDKTNQLLSSTFKACSTAWDKEVNTLDESMTYDYNGNILTLKRNRTQHTQAGLPVLQPALLDDLTFTYASPNQVTRIEDAVPISALMIDFRNNASTTTEYTYNSDGSELTDLNKAISITYEPFIGKPSHITVSGGSVDYKYDASGTKLQMTSTVGGLPTVTDYVNGFLYTTPSGAGRSLVAFSSPEGRVVKNGSIYEHQYAISDHQGNTRTIFTSAPPAASSVTAQFEGADGTFNCYPTSTYIQPGIDHTTGTMAGHSLHLNGYYGGATLNGAVGLGKIYNVFPGDQLQMDGWVKFDAIPTGSPSGLTSFAAALVTAFGLTVPPVGETVSPASGLNLFGGFEAAGYDDGDTNPLGADSKCFFTILLFDLNWEYVGVSYAPAPAGVTTFTSMTVSYTVKEPGYAFLYVSNEESTPKNVYFDDITITYTPSAVVQYSDYYPYGEETQFSWTRSTPNNFLYNNRQELNQATGLYDLRYRNYDPATARFIQEDPLASTMPFLSPYHYGYNNPVLYNDPSGLAEGIGGEGGQSPSEIDAQEYQAFLQRCQDWDDWVEDFMDAVYGDGRGGGAGGVFKKDEDFKNPFDNSMSALMQNSIYRMQGMNESEIVSKNMEDDEKFRDGLGKNALGDWSEEPWNRPFWYNEEGFKEALEPRHEIHEPEMQPIKRRTVQPTFLDPASVHKFYHDNGQGKGDNYPSKQTNSNLTIVNQGIGQRGLTSDLSEESIKNALMSLDIGLIENGTLIE